MIVVVGGMKERVWPAQLKNGYPMDQEQGSFRILSGSIRDQRAGELCASLVGGLYLKTVASYHCLGRERRSSKVGHYWCRQMYENECTDERCS